ncbi:glucose galactose transporter [Lasiosphaeria ovina]|uniref:Glucose galactose transporter n=1 Tax=Lasiosphaeria ovina TaxID=92902 RepID=A0AAE0NB04_9PEZI|nr:glucose galactose transporter [Lasiosphaeria ovina]
MGLWRRKITTSDDTATSAAYLTLRASVTILFFLWGFAYGLLDERDGNHGPPTVLGRVLRRYGFRVTFMAGLAVFAVGCLLFWPSGVQRSFGGFCGSMFVIPLNLDLNLAQAVQGVGSSVAPLLASRVFFANAVGTGDGLRNVQRAYLDVAGFDALLIALFFLAPMPEITDADMHLRETEIGEYGPGPLRKQTNLFLAVAAANYFINFCKEAGRDTAASSPALAAIELLMLVLSLESLCFATIYTKLGGSLLVAAISGGMDAHTAMAIPMVGYILALISCYPIYGNVWKRDVMDAYRVGPEPAAPHDAYKALQFEAPDVRGWGRVD